MICTHYASFLILLLLLSLPRWMFVAVQNRSCSISRVPHEITVLKIPIPIVQFIIIIIVFVVSLLGRSSYVIKADCRCTSS